MKKLLKNKKGFTLMEMLIVIAIIVILVAISVPTFSAQLDKANKATDDANLRTAKMAAQVEYAANGNNIDDNIYDISTGKFVAKTSYTKGAYGKASGNTSNVLYADVDTTTGEVTVKWDAAP